MPGEIDPFNQLRMEYNSIRAIIESYTGDGSITSYLNGLKEAIDKADSESLNYYLERVISWYDANLSAIEQNEYVTDNEQREHSDARALLKKLSEKLQNYDFSKVEQAGESRKKNGKKKIFLSHRSSDKRYGDALEKLIIGLGVKNDQLIYTSHPLHKIPLGMKIYDYLRDNINDQVFMVILWSNDYLQSPACLSEMGAAWVLQTDYLGIYTPDFSFGNPKYHEVPIDTTKMGAVLNGDANCKASMIEFKNKIQSFFALPDD
nr:toll/interleukin-1 receptor domain-containing protein [Lachnospiraceae bacterium]